MQSCPICEEEHLILRKRVFTEDAWAALIRWNEIEIDLIDQPLCNTCYSELRQVLVDRANEFEQLKTAK